MIVALRETQHLAEKLPSYIIILQLVFDEKRAKFL